METAGAAPVRPPHGRPAALAMSRRFFGLMAAALLAFGFVVLLALAGISYWLGERVTSQSASILEAQEIQSHVNALIALAERAENGRRGYVLTGGQTYRNLMDVAAQEAAEPYTRLAELIPDGSPDFATLQEFNALLGQEYRVILDTIALVESEGTEAAQAAFAAGGTASALADLRQVSRRFLDRSAQLIAADADQLRGTARMFSVMNIVGALVVVGLMLASVFLVLRYTRELNASQQRIAGFNEELERQVKERTAELTHANAEIQRFAYIVSHDLRAPLVNIMGFTSELEAGLGTVRDAIGPADREGPLISEDARTVVEEDWPEALAFIRKATDKMDRLINAILKLSREGRRVFAPQRLDMTGLVKGLAESASHQAQAAGAEIVVETLPDIVSDRLAVEQVLGNLLDNALKYLDSNRPGRIEVTGHPVPGGVAIDVKDNGRGIDAGDHERVFELFRRSGAQDRPGEGIGLAHVRTLVRRLGGSITLSSALGVGTTFHIVLPKVLRRDKEEERTAA